MTSEDLYLEFTTKYMPRYVNSYFQQEIAITPELLNTLIKAVFKHYDVVYPETEGQFNVEPIMDSIGGIMILLFTLPKPIHDVGWIPYSIYITDFKTWNYYQVTSNVINEEHSLRQFKIDGDKYIFQNKGKISLDKRELILTAHALFKQEASVS